MQTAVAAANVVNQAAPFISLASSAYGAYNTYQAGRAAKARTNFALPL